ncbi:hypothetical protein CKO40_10590 [Halochromatium glycolicum]|uniref:Uncharacterized protein n=1 Tax=Halochromatium glycolicum TaxID=85075 RepID=A0AAJ0X9N0_9GAMM|nr:hypothetical protein [Halochromatium glycolicum]
MRWNEIERSPFCIDWLAPLEWRLTAVFALGIALRLLALPADAEVISNKDVQPIESTRARF